MNIAYITNAKPGSGVGDRADAILGEHKRRHGELHITEYAVDGGEGMARRNGDTLSRIRPWPGFLGSKSVGWIRLARQLPAKAQADGCTIWHATNQTLSFSVTPTMRSVVTVHDIIEVLEPQSGPGGILAKYLYRGIPRADHLIAVSQYTAQSIQDYWRLPAGRITVIPNGVGVQFVPLPDWLHSVAHRSLRLDLQLDADAPVILYVGSEHPRKNLGTALTAFSRVLAVHPTAVFVKVGLPGLPAGRRELLSIIDRLGIRDSVRLVGQVPSERLVELYNLASVFIYPSYFEGFGLPVVQAFACGTPVVAANTTSLPEVAGDAALLRHPDDVDGFATDLLRILGDQALAAQLAAKGQQRAKQFSWAAAARREAEVYKMLS